MDQPTILVLTLAGLLLVALLVIGGLSLSARAFTTLTELIHLLGLQAIQQSKERPPAQTASSQSKGTGNSSSQVTSTPTESESQPPA